MYQYEYPHFAVTVDNVVFNVQDLDDIKVLLIVRKNPPYQGSYALPGGFLDVTDKNTKEGALRELKEETSLEKDDVQHTMEVCTLSDIGRDPRERVISIVYASICYSDYVDKVEANDDAVSAKWVSLNDLVPDTLAFDHRKAIFYSLHKLFFTNQSVKDMLFIDADQQLGYYIEKLKHRFSE